MRLTNSLRAWGTAAFREVVKQEIEALDSARLPLQQALTQGSYALDGSASVMVIDVAETSAHIELKVGVFYAGIIAGCSCADDPTPIDQTREYCELLFTIDRRNAQTEVMLLGE